jgi:hypothetical protein
MDRGLVTLIGMTIAYAASLLGMALAWLAWRRRAAAGGAAPEDSRPQAPR